MKKLILSSCFAVALFASIDTFAQQGFGTNAPDKSAAVDIVSSQRGFLIPRLKLTATDNKAPITATPAQSLLVYNTETAGAGNTAVSPGFYYWDTDKWVRIVSSSTEKSTKVIQGNNVLVDPSVSADGLTTTYKVSVGAGTNGQVLVTVPNPDPATVATQPFVSQWVNPAAFIEGVNGITITKNTTTGVNEIGIGGALTDTTGTEIVTDPNTGKTLAIQGLEVLTPTTFDPKTQNIMVMGTDGILKQVAPKTLIEDAIDAGDLTAKSLKTSGIITLNGATTDATNTLLKEVALDIRNKSIGPDKLDPAGATAGQIATVVETTPGDPTTTVIKYESPSTAIGKTLSTDGKIVIGDNTSTVNSQANAVLVPTQLSIKQGAIGNVELASGAVTADKMQSKDTAAGTNAPANTVPTANGTGGVTYQSVAAAAGKTLTGAGITVTAGNTVGIGTSLAQSVLADVTLGIANDAITTDKIAADAVTAAKINVDVAGAGLKQNATSGALEVDLTSAGIGKGLTTDSVIEITGTGATAINSATESVLKDITLSIGTDKITATHIAPDAVGASELADNAVASANIIDGAVTNSDIANGAVTADKMQSKDTAAGTDAPANTVATANGSGGVTYKTPNSLINVNNGLTRNTAASDVIQLGGNLIKPTAINTAVGDAGFTLAVTGLENVAATTATKNKAIVAQTVDGVLRTVDKVVTGTNVDIVANAGYSLHTPEVVVNVTLANADQTVVFPSAADAEGQVINIRIVNEDETHTGYLNILDTYGSMPFQAWIVKSNGTAWEIVGRN